MTKRMKTQRTDAGKNIHIKGTLRYFMTGSTKDKMLEADPNFEGGMIVHQGLEKMLTPYYKLYNEKVAGLFKLLLINLLQRKHFNSQCF